MRCVGASDEMIQMSKTEPMVERTNPPIVAALTPKIAPPMWKAAMWKAAMRKAAKWRPDRKTDASGKDALLWRLDGHEAYVWLPARATLPIPSRNAALTQQFAARVLEIVDGRRRMDRQLFSPGIGQTRSRKVDPVPWF